MYLLECLQLVIGGSQMDASTQTTKVLQQTVRATTWRPWHIYVLVFQIAVSYPAVVVAIDMWEVYKPTIMPVSFCVGGQEIVVFNRTAKILDHGTGCTDETLGPANSGEQDTKAKPTNRQM